MDVTVGYSVVRTCCVCDDVYNRVLILYDTYICVAVIYAMVMRPLRKIYNERYEIVRSTLCSCLLHASVRVID